MSIYVLFLPYLITKIILRWFAIFPLKREGKGEWQILQEQEEQAAIRAPQNTPMNTLTSCLHFWSWPNLTQLPRNQYKDENITYASPLGRAQLFLALREMAVVMDKLTILIPVMSTSLFKRSVTTSTSVNEAHRQFHVKVAFSSLQLLTSKVGAVPFLMGFWQHRGLCSVDPVCGWTDST